jgi:Asp/Glu/hydantoin racemase
MTISILVINPNSSQVITDGLEKALSGTNNVVPGVSLSYFTAPSDGPPSINDVVTSVQSAAVSFRGLTTESTGSTLLDKHDAFLVCCFSDHPLIHMLRESTEKPVCGIFEAAIAHALTSARSFGVLTTVPGALDLLGTGVRNFLGAHKSDRYAGSVASGLGVVELQEGDRDHVFGSIRVKSVELVKMGAKAVLLGCAGMTGMEEVVKQGVREAGLGEVRVIDGAKAGVETLASLVRGRY